MDKKSKALKMMLWFGIGSLIMTFAGLTSAFIVSKNRVDWVTDFPIPAAFYFSLFVIILYEYVCCVVLLLVLNMLRLLSFV